MRAIILVGGQAIRLRPITLEKPKALIELQGKTIVEHIFDLLKKYGITDVILSVGYLKEQIKDYFGDGSKFGVKTSYLEENEPLGTAGPLNLLPKKITETFIVGNGDELKEINIDKMLEFHRQMGGLATLALTKVDDPSMYGVARMRGYKILEFVEKPKKEEAPSNLINAGFYILEPEVLNLIPQGRAMFEYDVFPKLASAGKLYGFEFLGQWFDAGNLERLKKAEKEWRGIRND